MTYASLAQVKSALRLPAADTIDDDILTVALNAADSDIDIYCGRSFSTAGTADASRVYAASKPDTVEIDDMTAITTVEYSRDGSTWTATTDYQAEPLNSMADGVAWPFTRLRTTNSFAWPVYGGLQTVRVTGRFAFGYVPDAVVQAAIFQTIFLFKRNDAPFGVTYGEMGALRVGGSMAYGSIDPTAGILLARYRKGTAWGFA